MGLFDKGYENSTENLYKNIEKYGCLNLYIYKKGNELTKLVFTE